GVVRGDDAGQDVSTAVVPHAAAAGRRVGRQRAVVYPQVGAAEQGLHPDGITRRKGPLHVHIEDCPAIVGGHIAAQRAVLDGHGGAPAVVPFAPRGSLVIESGGGGGPVVGGCAAAKDGDDVSLIGRGGDGAAHPGLV